MANDSSATAREEAPHVNRTSRTNTNFNALKQRAQSVLKDRSIDAQSRAIIRYALEINDPWLAKLVRRAEAGETIVDTIDVYETHSTGEAKIGPLAEMICRGGEEAAAAFARSDGNARKFYASESACAYGEASCFYALR